MSRSATGEVDEDGTGTRSGWLKRVFDSVVGGLTLRQRILLVLAVAALPGIAVAFALAASKLSDETRQIETSVNRLAALGAAQHESVLNQARILLASNAERIAGGDLRSGCSALETLPKGFPAVTAPVLFDMSGNLICSGGGKPAPFDAEGKDWLARALEEETFVLGDYSIVSTGMPLLVAAYSVTGGNGENKGVLALGIDLRWLDFIATSIDLPQRATISAISPKGQLLSHNAAASSSKGTPAAAPPAEETRETITGMPEGGARRGNDASGSPRVYGFARTADGGLIVVVGSPRYYDFIQYGDALLHTLLAPLTILVIGLLAAGWAAEVFVTRHVRSMTRTAEQVTAGNMAERTGVPYEEHEIGRLADAFDGMVEHIEAEHTGLRADVEDRDVLVRELNHRVKNYLQMMLSMVEIDRRDISPENAAARLDSLSGRVRTLAEAHRLLHQDANDDAPALGSYTRNLAKLLGTFYESKVGPVRVSTDVAMVSLGIHRSVSYGLILNELISNAQKHAFPDGRKGRIAVSLNADRPKKGEATRVRLTVTDDGVGFPEGVDIADCSSTGMRVVQALARQLEGEVRAYNRKTGGAVELSFLLPK